MKAVKVEYTVKPEYVAQNKANVEHVMQALRNQPIEGMHYSTFIKDDGQTFVHINMAQDGDTMSKLGDVPEFQHFRSSLKASGPLAPPKSTNLKLVGASFNL